jgi:PilZ domain
LAGPVLRNTVFSVPTEYQQVDRGESAKPADGRHKRKWQRYDVTIPVHATAFVEGVRSTLQGRACDVSAGGLCLFATRHMEVGTNLLMEFLLPYSSPKITVRGVIRNRSGFSYGIEFVNASHHQKQMIERTCKAFELLGLFGPR